MEPNPYFLGLALGFVVGLGGGIWTAAFVLARQAVARREE